ncbi:MAG: hypothetical protein HOA14_12355, partial [Planctomycetaceae bacterium]|nr:hypothetical protein [Planctomycetaceae bacterium]
MDGVEKQQQLFSDFDDTCAASGSDDGESTAVTKVTDPANVIEVGEVQKVESVGPSACDSVQDEVVYIIDSFS